MATKANSKAKAKANKANSKANSPERRAPADRPTIGKHKGDLIGPQPGSTPFDMYGNRPGTISAECNAMLAAGTYTLADMVLHTQQTFGRTEKQALAKVRAHINWLPKNGRGPVFVDRIEVDEKTGVLSIVESKAEADKAAK